MRVRIDQDADAVYIDLAERDIARSEELDAETLQNFNFDSSRAATA